MILQRTKSTGALYGAKIASYESRRSSLYQGRESKARQGLRWCP